MRTISQRLSFTRSYLGLSLIEVSTQTGIALTRLEGLENGDDVPSQDELLAIAQLYRFPFEFLTNQADLPVPESIAVVPRIKTQITAKDREELVLFSQFLMVAGRANS